MLTARYRQKAGENLRKVVDLERWLASGETLVDVIPPDVVLDATVSNVLILPDSKSFQFFLRGDEPGSIVDIDFEVETSQGQTRIDRVQLVVS